MLEIIYINENKNVFSLNLQLCTSHIVCYRLWFQKLFWSWSGPQFNWIHQRRKGWWNNIVGFEVWFKSNCQRGSQQV